MVKSKKKKFGVFLILFFDYFDYFFLLLVLVRKMVLKENEIHQSEIYFSAK